VKLSRLLLIYFPLLALLLLVALYFAYNPGGVAEHLIELAINRAGRRCCWVG
jgi:hypothetical protein